MVSQALLVATFGTSATLDRFFLALIVPGFLAVPLAAAGELAFAPGMARLQEDRRRFASLVVRYSARRGAVLAVVATVLAPVGVWISALGQLEGDADSAVQLARILYPSVFPVVVTAACSALLVAVGRVAAPTVIQSVRPLAIIVVLALAEDPSIEVLAIVVLLSAFLEALLALAVLHRTLWAASPNGHGPADQEFERARQALRVLIGPYVINQATPIADQAFAASLGEGVLVRYVLAVRFYDVGKGLLITPTVRLAQNAIAKSLGTPTLPVIVRFHARRLLIAGLLSGLGLAVAGPFLLLFAFTNGEFTRADALGSSAIVVVLAGSICMFGVFTYLVRLLSMLGRSDATRNALVIYAVVSIGLNAALAPVLGAVGIALATLLSVVVGVALCWVPVRKVLSDRETDHP